MYLSLIHIQMCIRDSSYAHKLRIDYTCKYTALILLVDNLCLNLRLTWQMQFLLSNARFSMRRRACSSLRWCSKTVLNSWVGMMNFGFFIGSDWSVFPNSFIYSRLRQNRRYDKRQSLGTRLTNSGSHDYAEGLSTMQLFLKV